MEEFDLNNIWKQSEDKADDYYNTIKSELMEKAKKNSNNILEKIKNNIKFEWAFSILLGVFILVYTLDPVWVAIYIIASIIMWLPYRGLLKSINDIQTKNITEALGSYINVLDNFIQRLKVLTIILLPLSVCVGLMMFVSREEAIVFKDLFDIKGLYFTAFLLVYSLLMAWMIFGWYIPYLYGRPKKELEEILLGLNEEIS